MGSVAWSWFPTKFLRQGRTFEPDVLPQRALEQAELERTFTAYWGGVTVSTVLSSAC